MKTELVVLVDRSGSMYNRVSTSTEGVNSLIEKQKEEEGYCRLTLAEFDDFYKIVHDGDIQDAPVYKMVVGSRTRLNDAIGKTIQAVQKRITKRSKASRPNLVLFVVVTDGMENDSREFTSAKIANMIQACKDNGWQFTYLCNDKYSEQYGSSLGFASVFSFNPSKDSETYEVTNEKLSRVRDVVRSGASKEVIDESNQYTMAEKRVMQ